MNGRAIVDRMSIPAWARGVKLRFDKTRQQWMLVAPERVLMPDGVALDIIKKIDGGRSVNELTTELAGEYKMPQEEIRPDIVGFLQQLADQGLLTL